MPLRDHFHQPLWAPHHWEGFHSAWANTIVRHLNARLLPARYRAEPHVRLGTGVEVDAATFEKDAVAVTEVNTGNGIATAVWAPPQPAQTFAIDFTDQDLFEVRVYDAERGLRLVAAVELVSPRNKDRPDSRHAFAVKCASYLQQEIALIIVDLVTDRHDNLHHELMQLLDLSDSSSLPEMAQLYAVAYRTTHQDGKPRLETWPQVLALGAALPTLPLWLASDLAVPLELEATYDETCQVLRLR